MKKLHLLWQKIKNNYSIILVVLFLSTLYFVLTTNLGRDYLFDWDEGIYGELGRQLILRKDLFTTFWNGLPWFEKPPGVAWIAALGIALGGDSAYGARLLFPLIAIYTLWITYLIAKKLGDWRTGIVAAGVLATFNLFLGRTRAVNTDMPLLSCITTTIWLLLENRPSLIVAFGIFFGVWFKGLAGLLTILVSLPLIFSKPTKYIISLVKYSVLLILPWHLYMLIKHGSAFLTPYFYEQVITRATTQIEFHFESRWYYLTYLYQNLGLGVLVVAAVGAMIAIRDFKTDPQHRSHHLLLIWWVGVPLSIFTLAKTRLFWYILPIYPALAIMIGYAITRLTRSNSSKSILNLIIIGILLQSILTARSSVEVDKVTASAPDRLQVALDLQGSSPLLVLVPKTERLAEALLPKNARLTSSFRYGGMPSLVYYYHGPVEFFYDVDRFNTAARRTTDMLMVSRDDLSLLTFPYHIVTETKEYLGLSRLETYANR